MNGCKVVYERDVPVELRAASGPNDPREVGALEAIHVRILVQGEPAAPSLLRVELSSDSNLYFHYTSEVRIYARLFSSSFLSAFRSSFFSSAASSTSALVDGSMCAWQQQPSPASAVTSFLPMQLVLPQSTVARARTQHSLSICPCRHLPPRSAHSACRALGLPPAGLRCSALAAAAACWRPDGLPDAPLAVAPLQVTPAGFQDLAEQQGLMVEFANYPAVLMRMLNACIKEPHLQLAVLAMQPTGLAQLDFIQVGGPHTWQAPLASASFSSHCLTPAGPASCLRQQQPTDACA